MCLCVSLDVWVCLCVCASVDLNPIRSPRWALTALLCDRLQMIPQFAVSQFNFVPACLTVATQEKHRERERETERERDGVEKRELTILQDSLRFQFHRSAWVALWEIV